MMCGAVRRPIFNDAPGLREMLMHPQADGTEKMEALPHEPYPKYRKRKIKRDTPKIPPYFAILSNPDRFETKRHGKARIATPVRKHAD